MLIRSIYGETRGSSASRRQGLTKRNAKSISPSKTSWGGAPTKKKMRKHFAKQKQVGVAETAP